MSAPASAPSPAASAKLAIRTRCTSMPTRDAASGFCAVARMARPNTEQSKNHFSTAAVTASAPTTHRLWVLIAAPSRWIGASPEKAGVMKSCLPSVTCTTPRIRIDAPSVMMINVARSALPAGRIAV